MNLTQKLIILLKAKPMDKKDIAVLIQELLVKKYGLMNTQTVHDDGYTAITADTKDNHTVRVVVQVLKKYE